MKAGTDANTAAVGAVEIAVKAHIDAFTGVMRGIETGISNVEASVRSVFIPSAASVGSAVGENVKVSIGDMIDQMSDEENLRLGSEFGMENTDGAFAFPDSNSFEEVATFLDEDLSEIETAFRGAVFGDGEGEGMYGNLVSMISTSGITAIFTDSKLVLLDDFSCELVLGPVDIAGHVASWTLDLCLYDNEVRKVGMLFIGIAYVAGFRIIFTRRG